MLVIVSWTLQNKLPWNCSKVPTISVEGNVLVNVVAVMNALLSRSQCVKFVSPAPAQSADYPRKCAAMPLPSNLVTILTQIIRNEAQNIWKNVRCILCMCALLLPKVQERHDPFDKLCKKVVKLASRICRSIFLFCSAKFAGRRHIVSLPIGWSPCCHLVIDEAALRGCSAQDRHDRIFRYNNIICWSRYTFMV